jgi:ABC-2 type transport system permease protein
VLSPSLYIIVCSARNRLRVRLRRLREPRYLIGAVAGAAYLYFSVVARMWGARAGSPRRGGRTPTPDTVLPILRTAGTGVAAGLALLVMATLGWLLPVKSGLLEFTEAEIQFLFPAPLLRRHLLIHRLMRSQLGLLFAAIVPAIAFPLASVAGRARFALSMWLLLVTAKVYFAGVTLARTRLASPSAGARLIAWLPIGLLLAALIIVGNAMGREFLHRAPTTLSEGLLRLGRVGTLGLPGIVLWPFVALARPLFAVWPGAYLAALAGSLTVLGVTAAWMLAIDEAFQDAAAEAAERRAARVAAQRTPIPRVRTTGWTLRPSGRPEAAFLWKSAMQMLRATSGATLVRYLAPLVILGSAISSLMMSANQTRGRAAALCLMAVAAAAFAVLLGPQVVRTDLRADLGHLELLKTWPVKASAVIRGEMLWPVCVVTLVGWFAILCATMFSAAAFPEVTLASRLSISSATALLAPALISAQYAIHNVTAVLLPAWVPIGDQRPRGLDAMGQRLILFGGVLVSLAVMVLPGAAAGAAVVIALQRYIGPAALIPAAAVCGAIVLIEVFMATEAIAPAYERMDLMSVEIVVSR